MSKVLEYDVAIVGGGPGGSTTGALLKKYRPDLRVLILEKEKFPREHIGESQLPAISVVLEEMGCWDKVEAANFPIKLGVTYTWGKTMEPWRFEFIPVSDVPEKAERPGKYEGWRRNVAFQVERSTYDKILLDHAGEMGCDVREQTMVRTVKHDGDRVTGLMLENGDEVKATYYVDASGNPAVIRRTLGIHVDVPSKLKNIAFWDYWDNPAWAEELSAATTRIHIRSVGFGWVWWIPLSTTRASIGLVCPAEYYKSCGKTPEELYLHALRSDRLVAQRQEGASREGVVRSTTDWSYVVERTYGENWFLVGESSGFADPILSAGLTLTQTGARELAYTIIELERGEHDRAWLLERFDDLQIRRVRQHIRFADYWYSANGIFENIRENCVQIAKENGLRFNPADAFRWLSQGGLTEDYAGQAGVGGLDLAGVKQIMARFAGTNTTWQIDGKNVFTLNLKGATETTVGSLQNGRIKRVACYLRGDRRLPCLGVQGMLVAALKRSSDIETIINDVRAQASIEMPEVGWNHVFKMAVQVLEVMVTEYWVTCSVKKGKAVLDVKTPIEGEQIFTDKLTPSAGAPHAA